MSDTSYTTDVVIRQTSAPTCPPNYRQVLHAEHLARQARFAANAREFERQQAAPVKSPPPPRPKNEPSIEVLRRRIDAIEADLARQRRDAAIICGTDANLMEAAHPWIVDAIRRKNQQPKISDIQKIICEFYDIKQSDMRSARRSYPVVEYRQIAMYLCRFFITKSLPEISRQFGRDHTTGLWAIRKIGAMIGDHSMGWDPRKRTVAIDPKTVADVVALKARIEALRG